MGIIEEIKSIIDIGNICLEEHHSIRKLGRNAVIMAISFVVANQLGFKELLPAEYQVITVPLFYLAISMCENYLKHNPIETWDNGKNK